MLPWCATTVDLVRTFLVTVAYLGRLPVAPGSFGALAALPAAYLLRSLHAWQSIALCSVLSAASLWVIHGYLLQQDDPDPQEIVLDEWLGCLIALLFVPWQPLWTTLAFALFRFFDIRKPGPVGLAERKLPGAFGVLGDDLVAGLLAGLLARGLMLAWR